MSLEALTQAALLGTGRQAAPAVDLPLARRAAAGPEQQLLRDAAVLRVYRDAGARPERVGSLPAPAPEETRPVCPQAAGAHLATILATYPDLLEGWLQALGESGRVIGPWHIRALLDHATDNAEIALALEPVLSERARWLAGQHEHWSWAAVKDPAERWQTGTRAERLHVLALVRARDPHATRALIESTFAHDAARDREAFVAALAPAFPEDEPFLESALSDRSQLVRAQAAVLLSGIRGSALSERMRSRAAELVDVGRRTITVQLPRELTPELARDGLTDTPPQGYGRGAWLASQIIGLAPLDHSPDLLGRRVADGNGDLLRQAWTVAAIRQRDPEWSAALLERDVSAHAAGELLGALPREQAEEFALRALKRRRGDWLAEAVPAPWSPAFTRKVAERVAGEPHAGQWADLLAQRGDPALADHLQQSDSPQLRDVAAKLALRRAMLDALKETV